MGEKLNKYGGLALVLVATWFFWLGFITFVEGVSEDRLDPADFNGSLYVSPPAPAVNLSCPACPDCVCKATCSAMLRAVEGCHIPEYYFSRSKTVRSYTGFSNIPSLFMGNVLETVNVRQSDALLPGCFYGFENGGQEVVHRLLGVYSEYVEFRGDNNEDSERVAREDVEYLVVGVEFK